MFFFNLSFPEFLALLGSASGVLLALYLLDRQRKKQTVATLRFFTALDREPQYKHRRRLQQPWSLLLQLLSLALLLLAIAQLRIGSPDRYSRDHVLILDTSAWMAARSGPGRLIDQARATAKAYVRSLPGNDRVMIVRADALATPATLFESDRSKLERVIDQTQPGAAVLNLEQALVFAREAQKMQAQRPGEIAFAGAGRIPANAPPPQLPANLRVLSVNGPAENLGLRKLGARRSLNTPDAWEIFVAVKNYGKVPHAVPLMVQFGGAPVGTRRFNLAPGAEDNATFRFSTRAAGWLEARLGTHDAFQGDDRAVLELPARDKLPVTIYTDRPETLKPVLNAIAELKPQFLPVARYQPKPDARIVILDRFGPPAAPQVDSIWIAPPVARSPVAVKGGARPRKLTRWRSDSELGAGLHGKDIELSQAQVFTTQAGDIPIAESDAGALIVARPGTPKVVVLGFHPLESGMKYELSTPLLFANVLRWMSPDTFKTVELVTGPVGTVSVPLETETDPRSVKVMTEDGRTLPFTISGRELRFFSGSMGIVRVLTGAREAVYSLTMPEPGDIAWDPPSARKGVPRRLPFQPNSRDIWQWLAVLGGLGLLAEWLLFGRTMRRQVKTGVTAARRMLWRKAS